MKSIDRQLVLAVVLFLVLLLIPTFASQYVIHVGFMILLYAYLATAWNLLGGYAGQHSLGHGLFLGIGAYASTYLFVSAGITPWLGMWIGAVIAGATGWFVGYLCFRYGIKGPYFALVTIALAEAAVYIAANIQAIGGAGGLEVPWKGNDFWIMQFGSRTGYYYIALVVAFLGVLLTLWISRNRFGYYLTSVRENEDAAEALGVNTMRAKLMATTLSAAMTAIGGTLYAQYFTYMNPRSVFGEGPSVQILLFAIIGGIGTVWGPAVGALVLVPIAEISRAELSGSFAGADLLIYGLILMLVMLFMPNGILGVLRSFWKKRKNLPQEVAHEPARSE